LKQLERAGVPRSQLLHFYISVIRPVLEYAVPVWHHLLTNSIASVQKRAFCIFYSFSNDIPYRVTLWMSQILAAYPLEETNSLIIFFSFHSSPYLFSPLLTPSPEILIYLFVF